MKVLKIHQAIALRKGETGRNESFINAIHKANKKPVLFSGHNRNYDPLNDAGEKLPTEQQVVQRRTSDDLKAAQESISKLFDTVARVEYANVDAKADVIVNGETVLSDVPVTYLLFLEKQLTNIRTLVATTPELDSNEEWAEDANTGLFKTDVVRTHRTRKVEKALVLLEQTEFQQGKAEKIVVDELAGYWNTTKVSGAIQPTRKAVLASRVDDLLDAVKIARSEANENDAPDVTVGNKVMSFIFA